MENSAIEKVEEAEKRNSEKQRLKEQKRRIKEFKRDEKAKARLAYRREKSKHLAELEEAKRAKKQQEYEKRKMEREEKSAEKENRKRLREDRKRRKKNSWKRAGGLKVAVVCLSVVVALTVTALTYNVLTPSKNDTAMGSLYEKSYYDTVTQIDNVDVNLSKAIVTTDTGALQRYLINTAINCELAENDINQLPLQDESKFYTTKLINQIGDYSKYLNDKLIDGNGLSVGEREKLILLYNANLQLKEALQEINSAIAQGYSFLSLLDLNVDNVIIDSFNQLQNLSVEYPELIYDGPFSDGADERVIKGLTESEITEDEGRGEFIRTFGEYGLSDITNEGENYGTIEAYCYSALVQDELLYAQMSKKGGKLLMFAYSGSCKAINYTRDEACEKALEFLSGQGLTNMEAVWINLTSNVYTVNFACTQDGVVIYSDLIKIRICAETGTVIGYEATSYYTNHTSRVIGKAKLTDEEARAKVSESIEIENSRLCVVPIGEESEKLCYEYSGRYNGDLYYVYIDCANGKQVEMFKVIDSSEGELLI